MMSKNSVQVVKECLRERTDSKDAFQLRCHCGKDIMKLLTVPALVATDLIQQQASLGFMNVWMIDVTFKSF